jgi:hypothetical protein
MSRKTEEIKKSISRLEEIQKSLEEGFTDEKAADSALLAEKMKSELENLKLWIGMLYKYNGTSKSRAKIAASRENGKKGGRPPKFVSDLKKQKLELELLLSDLHNQEIVSSFEDGQKLDEEKRKAESKLSEVEEKLADAVKK